MVWDLIIVTTLRPFLSAAVAVTTAVVVTVTATAVIAVAAVADSVAVVADVAFAAEVSVTTAVVVTVAVADAFVASVCAADSASPTRSGSRHDKLGRAHSTAEDAKRGRPLPAAGWTAVDVIASGCYAARSLRFRCGGGGRAGNLAVASHMHVACSW